MRRAAACYNNRNDIIMCRSNMKEMIMEKIKSKQNEKIKKVCGLIASKRDRDAQGLFVCEGIRLCMDGVKTGLCPQETYITEYALKKYPEISEICGKSERAYLITNEIAEKISDTDMPQGVFAVFKKLDNLKTAVKIRSGEFCETGGGKSRYVILSSLQDPGNMGAVMRTCEALGITGLIISADCPDIYAPKTIRASMGGLFRLPIYISPDIGGEILALREQGVKVYAAALESGALSASGGEFAKTLAGSHLAAVIGNEGSGLSGDIVSACTGSVMIPMRGPADSLNAAVAAGILIWEMTKNRD